MPAPCAGGGGTYVAGAAYRGDGAMMYEIGGGWMCGGGGGCCCTSHVAVALLAIEFPSLCSMFCNVAISALRVDTPSRTACVLALLTNFTLPNVSIKVVIVSSSSVS